MTNVVPLRAERAPDQSRDLVTVLQADGAVLAKTWGKDGTIKPYGGALHYLQQPQLVRGIGELSKLLTKLETKPQMCVIRGQYAGDDPTSKVLRRKAVFNDQRLHWILVEVDKFESLLADPVTDPGVTIAEYIETLPAAFRDASYHWQLSSSAGHPTKSGLRAHLWFWLSEPRTSAELRAWAKAVNVPCDHAVFDEIQIHYTSAPVFELGVTDPIPVRSGFVQGARDAVELTIDPKILEKPTTTLSSSSGKPHFFTLDDIREMLSFIKNNVDREKWLHTLWALRRTWHAAEGRLDEHGVLGLADEWSARGNPPGYEGPADVEGKWLEADDRGDGYNVGSLVNWAKAGGWSPTPEQNERLNGAPCIAEDFDLLPDTGTSSLSSVGPRKLLLGPAGSRFSLDELIARPPEPSIIVDGYMLQDAGNLVAPGSTGKTTLALQESVHIILGKPLYGRTIKRPGAVLFVTAEDDRATTLFRLHSICKEMGLTHQEHQRVRDNFYIEDISDSSARLVRFMDGELRPTSLLTDFTALYGRSEIVYTHFDPTSLLGPGELHGNDGMSELMRVGRRLSRQMGSAVRFIHHVAKAVAREGTLDQYAGRGGSAFADNARFVHQLTTVESDDFALGKRKYKVSHSVPRVEEEIAQGNLLALLVHKLSYQRRDPHPIFLVRRGFTFESFMPTTVAPDAETSLESRQERVSALVSYVRARLEEGLKLTKNTLLEGHRSALKMTREQVRATIDMAQQTGQLVECQLPEGERQGSRKVYLAPAEGNGLTVSGEAT